MEREGGGNLRRALGAKARLWPECAEEGPTMTDMVDHCPCLEWLPIDVLRHPLDWWRRRRRVASACVAALSHAEHMLAASTILCEYIPRRVHSCGVCQWHGW